VQIISNYWIRLSRIWRILQVEESVIHRGGRPRLITPSEICRILHILRKPYSIIALLFIQNILFAQTCKLYSPPFLSLLNDTTLYPGFLGQWFNDLWRQWFNNLQRAALLTSLAQYDKILGQQQLFMVKYACGFNQSETGKYFEWIIIEVIVSYYLRRPIPYLVGRVVNVCAVSKLSIYNFSFIQTPPTGNSKALSKISSQNHR